MSTRRIIRKWIKQGRVPVHLRHARRVKQVWRELAAERDAGYARRFDRWFDRWFDRLTPEEQERLFALSRAGVFNVR